MYNIFEICAAFFKLWGKLGLESGLSAPMHVHGLALLHAFVFKFSLRIRKVVLFILSNLT